MVIVERCEVLWCVIDLCLVLGCYLCLMVCVIWGLVDWYCVWYLYGVIVVFFMLCVVVVEGFIVGYFMIDVVGRYRCVFVGIV